MANWDEPLYTPMAPPTQEREIVVTARAGCESDSKAPQHHQQHVGCESDSKARKHHHCDAADVTKGAASSSTPTCAGPTSMMKSPDDGAHGASVSSASTAPTSKVVCSDRVSWDADGFLKRLSHARDTGNMHEVKKVLREVAESNYKLRNLWGHPPRTKYLSHDFCKKLRARGRGRDPIVSFACESTADALLRCALDGKTVCALNFANGSSIGGGYKNGATAQEEDLCRRIPGLYTSLYNAGREEHYPFGPPTCTNVDEPKRYSDVLWTPDKCGPARLVLAREGEQKGYELLPEEKQVSVSIVSAAAPNLAFAKTQEVSDNTVVSNTIRTILLAPIQQNEKIQVIVLGAWGCGAFGGDPSNISELFCQALFNDKLGRLYEEVLFAIPAQTAKDPNWCAFYQTVQKYCKVQMMK